MNGPNKLKCCITKVRKGWPTSNALTYCASLKVTKKLKFCEYNNLGKMLYNFFLCNLQRSQIVFVLANLSSLVCYFKVRPGSYPREDTWMVIHIDGLRPYLQRLRLGWTGLPGSNTLAYLVPRQWQIKMFYNNGHWARLNNNLTCVTWRLNTPFTLKNCPTYKALR